MAEVAVVPSEDVGYFEVDVSATSGRKLKLIEEETRLTLVIDSIVNIGNEDFRDATGKVKTNYKVGVGFTTLVPQMFEDGEPVGRNVNFFVSYNFSFHEKSNLVKNGLVEAVEYDVSKVKLSDFVKGLLGKQVSAMIHHRKYKNKAGIEAVAMDLEKFKKPVKLENFAEVLAKWQPPYMMQKLYPNAKVVTWKNVQDGTKAQPVASYIVGEAQGPAQQATVLQ